MHTTKFLKRESPLGILYHKSFILISLAPKEMQNNAKNFSRPISITKKLFISFSVVAHTQMMH